MALFLLICILTLSLEVAGQIPKEKNTKRDASIVINLGKSLLRSCP